MLDFALVFVEDLLASGPHGLVRLDNCPCEALGAAPCPCQEASEASAKFGEANALAPKAAQAKNG